MPYNISKTKLEKFSLFSISSKKFGYGHFNRVLNLISILKNKKIKLSHYSYGVNIKNKNVFLKKLSSELSLNKNIVVDITNENFLDSNTIFKIKKIFNHQKESRIYVIDSPEKKNLSTQLNLKKVRTLIPFEVSYETKKKLSKIKNKKIGFDYFIYSTKNLKKNYKLYDIILSFGGVDKYKGTLYVLKLLDSLKVKNSVITVNGKFFKDKYKKKIFNLSKKNKFKIKPFSKKFNNFLSKSKLLITNSGLTKYEGFAHGLQVVIFSDSKESQVIDKVFINKTKQTLFSYKKRYQEDMLRLKFILPRLLKLKSFDKKNKLSNIAKIKNFFKK